MVERWAWGLPLVVLTVLVHAFGLSSFASAVVVPLSATLATPPVRRRLGVIVATTVLLLTLLHALEAGAWAAAYVGSARGPTFASAMLYSLSAMTTYGHADIFLARHWRLMGALRRSTG